MGDQAQASIGFGVQAPGDEELAGAPSVAMNVLVDGAGAVRRRPGIATYAEFPSTAVSSYEISGIYTTLRGQHYCVDQEPGHRRIRRLAGGSALDITAPVDADLRGTRRPTFAETEALLAIAGGKEVQKISLLTAGTPSARLGGSPPYASHIVAQGSRFLVNNVETPLNQVNFSDPGTGEATTPFETWSGTLSSGSFKAEANPGPVVAVHRTMNEVWCFGATATQIFATDPNFVYTRATEFETGCVAPYSVIDADEYKAWFDDKRRFVLSTARERKVISGPIQKQLDELSVYSDAFGYRVVTDQFSCLVWTFPTDGRSFCFQMEGGWSQWSGFSDGWHRFVVNCHHLNRSTKDNLVGTTGGKVGKLTTSANDDLGNPIRAFCRSGYKSHGTDRRKTCNRVRLTFRRGTHDEESTPIVLYRYRNEDGVWKPPIPIVLDRKQKVVTLNSVGMYRRRQHEISYEKTGEAVVLESAVEEFTPQEN